MWTKNKAKLKRINASGAKDAPDAGSDLDCARILGGDQGSLVPNRRERAAGRLQPGERASLTSQAATMECDRGSDIHHAEPPVLVPDFDERLGPVGRDAQAEVPGNRQARADLKKEDGR
jgi:hypothetical protein